jgi:hypothetical protein
VDKNLRKLIQGATQDARRLLEREYAEQLEAHYDVLPHTGHISSAPGAHLDAEDRFIRERIIAAIGHERTKVATDKEAIAAFLREASFTTLNRFAALKLMESRRIVQECVSNGDQSGGFREFSGLAPGLNDLPDRGYRLYLECLFDEIGVEVGALFDRRHPSSLLWPRRPGLLELLKILNQSAIASVWAEDETIGWVYQYFNSEEDKKAAKTDAKGKPKPPQDSWELAVRNQFFTPRYVVQFLTDNTLGRIWYEMCQGQSRLKEQCHYMVRRYKEVFLQPEETPPEKQAQDNLTQEELLTQATYIPHRPPKDPREIRLLDPACGSMHFGLYAFDIYTTIYQEAWDLGCETLRQDFPDLAGFNREVPRLIIEHNVHGIDIDPRAAQIAGFALWLRAQRAWAEAAVPARERPQITKANVVCAEPMPGDKELLRDFTAGLNPPVLGQIVERVWEAMQLAGEAGSLLKVEEQISDWVREARRRWQKLPKEVQLRLFDPSAESAVTTKQDELALDLSGITDERFWNEAEERIYDSLNNFAAQAITGNMRQRLFADDALQGFAFIELCRKRYDVWVMNPPFGDVTKNYQSAYVATYPSSKADMACAFVERAMSRMAPGGRVGVLMTRTPFFLSSFSKWRIQKIISEGGLQAFVDLGYGVLDAMVETCAYVLQPISEKDS